MEEMEVALNAGFVFDIEGGVSQTRVWQDLSREARAMYVAHHRISAIGTAIAEYDSTKKASSK